MQGNTSAAIDFLRRWSPPPWVLTAIHPDQKSVITEPLDGPEDAEKWINRFNGNHNIYFQVNSVIDPTSRKPSRENIASMDWLHIDMDPRAGEPLEEEQARIKAKLLSFDPAPTVVVFSGGGYQGYWKLAKALPIGGDLSKAEDAKRYNQQLEITLGADACHNVDRIMRLPGTLNLPGRKKAKKGRKKALSEVVLWEPDRVYEIESFMQAPAVQSPTPGLSGGGATDVDVDDGNIRRYEVEDLNEWDVPDRLKVILVQGRHPDETKEGDDSRSAWLFDAVCNLVRCNVPDPVIYSIITDKGFGISESVLDKRSNMKRYALKQIRSAKEHVVNPRLREMNDRFAVIRNIGGRCRIIEEVWHPILKRNVLTDQGFDDFRNGLMHIKVEIDSGDGKKKLKPLGHWWLEHPERQQYDTIVFAPGGTTGDSVYNLWKGYACEAREGDCDLFLDHVHKVICQGDDDRYRYLLSWMARAVQEPNSPGEVAIVLQGDRGAGKSIFAKIFGSLFGRHFMEVANASHLVGNFNGHLQDVVVLFADEAFFAGDKKHASVLKNLITSDLMAVEKKYRDTEQAANFIHLIMASNDDHVIPAGEYERRFFMLRVADSRRQDTKYFKALMDQMDNGGREALLHYLMSYDLTGFNVRAVPSTTELQEQKLLTLPPMGEWWYQILSSGKLIGTYEWGDDVPTDSFYESFIEHAEMMKLSRRSTKTALGKFLSHYCPMRPKQKMITRRVGFDEGDVKVRKERVRVYQTPSLAVARKAFERAIGGQVPWDVSSEEQLTVEEEHVL